MDNAVKVKRMALHKKHARLAFEASRAHQGLNVA